MIVDWWSRQELNLDRSFRKAKFYPLYYGTVVVAVGIEPTLDFRQPAYQAGTLPVSDATMLLYAIQLSNRSDRFHKSKPPWPFGTHGGSGQENA